MKALHIHNHYRYRGGEDVMFERIGNLLRANGHKVVTFERHSSDIAGMASKMHALASSVYSTRAKANVQELLETEEPDVVHVHNLYPLISPSVLKACVNNGVPVVMRCPNYRLECPTGVLMRKGRVCTECSGGREYRCAVNNCRGNVLESVAFAARNTMARTLGMFKKNVSVFAPPSHFVKSRLVAAGFPEDRICVVPNMVPVPRTFRNAAEGTYIALAGRFSEEKGIETIIEAAARLPRVPVRIAGDGPLNDRLRAMAPGNVTFVGQLSGGELSDFYSGARACVVPSRWYEAFGLVAAEAMSYGIPVIATNMAGLAEIVDHGETGFHFTTDDSAELAEHINTLWTQPALARAFGIAGRKKVEREYSEQAYYLRLMGVYETSLGTKSVTAPTAELAKTA